MDSSVSPTHGEQECSAYNLGNFLRHLALPREVKQWSLTMLRNKLIKIGAKVIRHARYVTILERVRRFATLSPRAAPT